MAATAQTASLDRTLVVTDQLKAKVQECLDLHAAIEPPYTADQLRRLKATGIPGGANNPSRQAWDNAYEQLMEFHTTIVLLEETAICDAAGKPRCELLELLGC